MTASILIVGCGDIGQRIAARHLVCGDVVTGLVRRTDAGAALEARGIQPLIAALEDAWTIPAADAVYWCAPPPSTGEDDPLLTRTLARLAAPPRGLLYVSTTAVYGDCHGRWIDEAEPLKPGTARGLRRLAAERHLCAWAARTSARTVTLRVPGIYGPGRLPEARLRSGTPILCAEDAPFTNRIHADDLADAAVLALDRGAMGGAYNVGDGVPSTMTAYFLACAALLGLPAPPQIPLVEARMTLSPGLLSFLEESKRLRVDRLKALDWTPRYPTLAAGLAHCI